MVEGEGAGIANRILDANDTGAVRTRPLDHIEPVRVAVRTGHNRTAFGDSPTGWLVRLPVIALTSHHCVGCSSGPVLVEIEAWVVRRCSLPLWLDRQDEIDSLHLKRHTRGLIEAIRIRGLAVGMRPNV